MSDLRPGGDLVLEMLEGRASQPPDDLAPRIAMRVAGRRQARGPRRLTRLRGPLLIVLALAVVGSGSYLAGRLWRADGAAPLVQPAVSPSAGTSTQGSATAIPAAASDEVSSPATRPTAPALLAIDQIAVVTAEGFNLRVRSQPGVSDATTRLVPLLDAGTRMLILRGPIQLDGHDWYQVKIDGAPGFGWVAAAGGGIDWLAPAAPRCSGAREPSELWTRAAMDLLACYGEEPFAVQVVGSSGRLPTPCASHPDRQGCKAEPRWLLEPMTLSVVSAGADGVASVAVAVPDSVQEAIAAASPSRPLTILVALDRPSAQSCRIVDAAGLDVIARDEAVATCRLTFAVVAMAQ